MSISIRPLFFIALCMPVRGQVYLLAGLFFCGRRYRFATFYMAATTTEDL